MPRFIKKIKFSSVFWLVFYLLLGAILLNTSFSYLDPDFPWHKKVGEQIVIDKEVPSLNIYNFSFVGNWVDHEWLSDVAVYLISDNFGYIVLSVLFALLILVIFRLLHLRAKKRWPFLPDWFSALVQLFAVLASLPHFGVRIQEFALLFLLLLLAIIDEYLLSRKRWLLFSLPCLIWFWSMIHGSFLIGFFVIGLFILLKGGEKIFKNQLEKKLIIDKNNLLSWSEIIIFIIIFCLCFVVTLIGPYGAELYSFLYGYRDSYYLSHIQEWLPQHFFPFLYSQLAYLAFSVSALVLYIYSRKNKKRSFDFWNFILSLVFIILAFKSRRHFPLLVIAGFPFLAQTIGEFLEIGKKNEKDEKNKIHLIILKLLSILAMLLVFFGQTIAISFSNNILEKYCDVYPCEAKNFLSTNKQYNDLKLFNFYGWGGYLIHQLPKRQIFIDGRLPQVEYKGHSFLEEYYRFYSDNFSEIKERLSEHDISLVLIPTQDKDINAKAWEKFLFNIKDEELKVKNNLRLYLEASNEWQKIYSDEVASVYLQISK
jgi:hypothetical protein